MALVLIPPTASSVYVDATPSPLDRTLKVAGGQLGNGIIRPFQRDAKNDFANASGIALVKSCVGQILGMEGSSAKTQGELPWDPDRGSLLRLLRHKTSDATLTALSRAYIIETLQRYEPRVRIKGTGLGRELDAAGQPTIWAINLLYDVRSTSLPGNLVLYQDVSQTLFLPQSQGG